MGVPGVVGVAVMVDDHVVSPATGCTVRGVDHTRHRAVSHRDDGLTAVSIAGGAVQVEVPGLTVA